MNRNEHQTTPYGFTLIELMVAVLAGSFVVAGAFHFASNQIRFMGLAQQGLESHQGARAALDLLTFDLRHAGLGVGYAADGKFSGLMLGNYSVQGGAAFNANNRSISLKYGPNNQKLSGTYALTTDDIGIRMAAGDYRSVVDYRNGSGQICSGSSIKAGHTVLLMSQSGGSKRSVKIDSISDAGCTNGTCVGGCSSFTWSPSPMYVSHPKALTASYFGGEMGGGFAEVVWFVAVSDGQGSLRRVEASTSNTCLAADGNCGLLVVDGVETIQMSISQWDSDALVWVDRTPSQTILDNNRIRVDLEIVVRGAEGHRAPKSTVQLALDSGQCLPSPCGSIDFIQRKAIRTSIEIKNSGKMSLDTREGN